MYACVCVHTHIYVYIELTYDLSKKKKKKKTTDMEITCCTIIGTLKPKSYFDRLSSDGNQFLNSCFVFLQKVCIHHMPNKQYSVNCSK